MLDLTAILPQLSADVLGPAPAGLVGGAPDRHAADAHELESAEGHFPHLIRMVKALQYHLRGCVAHRAAPLSLPRGGLPADPLRYQFATRPFAFQDRPWACCSMRLAPLRWLRWNTTRFIAP